MKLYLIKIIISNKNLFSFANKSKLSCLQDTDYIVHSLLKASFSSDSSTNIKTFWYNCKNNNTEILCYSTVPADDLISTYNNFSDPMAAGIIEPSQIFSREINELPVGFNVGCQIRLCPIARTKSGERDVFTNSTNEDRYATYASWVMGRINSNTGATMSNEPVITQFQLNKRIRRTSGSTRKNVTIIQPEIEIKGSLTVDSAEDFKELMRNGIGRQKSFGYGMVRLFPL